MGRDWESIELRQNHSRKESEKVFKESSGEKRMKAWIIICILVAVAIAAAVFFYKLGKSLANMSRCGCKEKRS